MIIHCAETTKGPLVNGKRATVNTGKTVCEICTLPAIDGGIAEIKAIPFKAFRTFKTNHDKGGYRATDPEPCRHCVKRLEL